MFLIVLACSTYYHNNSRNFQITFWPGTTSAPLRSSSYQFVPLGHCVTTLSCRCVVWLSDRINSGLHLLPPALPQSVGPRVPQALSTDQSLSDPGAQACKPWLQTGCVVIHLQHSPVLSIVNLLSFYFQGNICTYL